MKFIKTSVAQQNFEEAMRWCKIIEKLNLHVPEKFELAKLYITSLISNYQKGIDYLKENAKLEHPDSINLLIKFDPDHLKL